MKSWYKILAFVVLGSFIYPNVAKLFHKCEVVHHCCDHTEDVEKDGFSKTNSHDSSAHHDCYICNFHYSGFEGASPIVFNSTTPVARQELNVSLQEVYYSDFLLSNPHRGPPSNFL